MRLIKRRFFVADGSTIETIGKNTIKLFTSINNIVRIEKVIYALDCDFNLILLGQLKKTGISYHDEGSYMVLKKNGTTIARALAVKNLFLLNIITNTTLAVRGKPTLFRGITKKKDFWHRKLCHAEYTRIQAATNITTGIDLKTPEQGNKKDADCLVHPDELNNGVINDLNVYDLIDYVYKLCALSKQTRVIYYNFIRFTISKLERVYIDF